MPIGLRFTESPVNGLGFITNAPIDADLTEIPRIQTSIFGTITLQYPDGLGEGDLRGSTKAEVIASAKEKALEDKYGYGPYWIDEITTFGCTDPNATNYCEDCEFHVGDWYCGYGCDDENRETDYLGNCMGCKEGFEPIQASKAKEAKCMPIESSENDTDTDTDNDTDTDTDNDTDTGEETNWGLWAVGSVVGLAIVAFALKR